MSDKLLSNDFLKLMEEIYEDGKVSPIELSNLKKQVASEKERVEAQDALAASTRRIVELEAEIERCAHSAPAVI